MTRRKTRIISIASGKGGAGKTTLAVNLAWSLWSKGGKVCLVDADLGLSNVDVVLGLEPGATLEDVVLKNQPLSSAITVVRPGFDVISGGSGVSALADLPVEKRKSFLEKLSGLSGYDFILLDNSPGINRQVVSFCLAAREIIMVINPEPSSVTDGYALLKVLKQNNMHQVPMLLFNRVPEGLDVHRLMNRFAGTCKKFLNLELAFLGGIPDDPAFRSASAQLKTLVSLNPVSPGAMAISRTAGLMVTHPRARTFKVDPRDFWEKSLVNIIQRASPDPPARRNSPGGSESLEALLAHAEKLVRTIEEKGIRKLSAVPGALEKVRKFKKVLDEIVLDPVQTTPSENPGLKQLRVGLLCPDESLRSMLEEILREKGHLPQLPGEKGFQDGLIPDILLCSMGKPDTDYLRALDNYKDIPCIWLSEYKKQVPGWAASIKPVSILEKPFTLDKIYLAVEEAAS
ncbi:AAA family ATPase [Desulfonatronovibrio hydrogenovorans]|uniref:AAA family ATPase n=1 Tax=Desulfonatronovibrio hydrogenovorans TaxID=53245 RepID=UPI0006899F58|nr:AAA family ATPase [Desulfonatronovibrio hydrogenovorans]